MKPRHVASKKSSKRPQQPFEKKAVRPTKIAPAKASDSAIQIFEPAAGTVYSIEAASHLANVSGAESSFTAGNGTLTDGRSRTRGLLV